MVVERVRGLPTIFYLYEYYEEIWILLYQPYCDLCVCMEEWFVKKRCLVHLYVLVLEGYCRPDAASYHDNFGCKLWR